MTSIHTNNNLKQMNNNIIFLGATMPKEYAITLLNTRLKSHRFNLEKGEPIRSRFNLEKGEPIRRRFNLKKGI